MRTSSWARACPRWRGDIAAYLVGALDPQASAAVRGHLGTCPACQAGYEDLAPVVGWLALLAPPGRTARRYRGRPGHSGCQEPLPGSQ